MKINETKIQHDPSGVGHAWRTVDAAEIPADILTEIECEIVEGDGQIIDSDGAVCDQYVASNGQHYRW